MSVLSSRRSRRRLTIAAVFVVVAIPLGYLAVHYSNSASPRDANGPYAVVAVNSVRPIRVIRAIRG